MSRAETINLGIGTLTRGGAIPSGGDEEVSPVAIVMPWYIDQPYIVTGAEPQTGFYTTYYSDFY